MVPEIWALRSHHIKACVLKAVDDVFHSFRAPAALVMHLDSYVPMSRLPSWSKACGEADRVVFCLIHSVPVEELGADRSYRVVFSWLLSLSFSVDADGVDVGEDGVAEVGDEGTTPAVGYIQGEDMLWEVSVGGFVHGVSFVVDSLAGHAEGFAWSRGGFVEFNAIVVLIGFDGEDERVDLVAKLSRKLEERAVVLGVDFF